MILPHSSSLHAPLCHWLAGGKGYSGSAPRAAVNESAWQLSQPPGRNLSTNAAPAVVRCRTYGCPPQGKGQKNSVFSSSMFKQYL